MELFFVGEVWANVLKQASVFGFCPPLHFSSPVPKIVFACC